MRLNVHPRAKHCHVVGELTVQRLQPEPLEREPFLGRLGIRMSRTLILLGLILVAVGLLWRWSGRSDIVVSVFILEFRHTRTADEPGKAQSRARHGGAVRQAYARRQRGTLARTIGKREGLRFTPKTRAMLAHLEPTI
jgi:hypothetical protein